jgi:hypothetical protein
MRRVRGKIVTRIFAFLMALHVFNLSIDTQDAQPNGTPEDLAINDQETIVEFLLETVFGYENAIAEHDEPDTEDGGTLDFNKFNLFYTQNTAIVICYTEVFEDYIIHGDSRISNHIPDPSSPPPKA